MGHHINKDGKFQSDKYPELPPDKIILSFHDELATEALILFTNTCLDEELADDIYTRLDAIANTTD